MTVYDLRFKNGLFFARESGHIEGADAKLWAQTLARHAEASPVPIVALVDARDMVSISEEARHIFVEAARTPNVKVSVIAANSYKAAQAARLVSLMSRESSHDTYIFNSLTEAERFAKKQLDEIAASV